ncbi:hypothetical protein A2239_00300 [Candidatus Uhrbacteria bacterium RIFOXYA2_FULL_40_9]|nr:MAG: hypothetical protein UT94_C0034G0020 [Candidatus Uhrbacteria bacterium GW2011_GWF2_40_263]OGL93859.1 MAG: hypothetical protein A2239_00300 [Candidatus Uhrbacteria bacterium RIFOXYA2_FULL_40_9]OGL97568.1 MAG: hypothetical protein A2332_03475 [Candidatus Uhrbacteria bacterium RIFOXYB2_FULL_41_18]HBK34885.1 hypothetical protein [Candidatus Uhrbacteria bacterium]HCB56097.1 hypothetical protein [Candidatus Uhrbacteria bacterium]
MKQQNPLWIITFILLLGSLTYWLTIPPVVTEPIPAEVTHDASYELLTSIKETTGISFYEIDNKEFVWAISNETYEYLPLMITGKRMSAKLIPEADYQQISTYLEAQGFVKSQMNTSFNDPAHQGYDGYQKNDLVCKVNIAYQLDNALNERTGLVNTEIKCGPNLLTE